MGYSLRFQGGTRWGWSLKSGWVSGGKERTKFLKLAVIGNLVFRESHLTGQSVPVRKGVARQRNSRPRRIILHNDTAEIKLYLRNWHTDSGPPVRQDFQGGSRVRQLERKNEIKANLRDAEHSVTRTTHLRIGRYIPTSRPLDPDGVAPSCCRPAGRGLAHAARTIRPRRDLVLNTPHASDYRATA